MSAYRDAPQVASGPCAICLRARPLLYRNRFARLEEWTCMECILGPDVGEVLRAVAQQRLSPEGAAWLLAHLRAPWQERFITGAGNGWRAAMSWIRKRIQQRDEGGG